MGYSWNLCSYHSNIYSLILLFHPLPFFFCSWPPLLIFSHWNNQFLLVKSLMKLDTLDWGCSLLPICHLAVATSPDGYSHNMLNTITHPPPNLTLLLVHWGSLGLHQTNLLQSQLNKLNFDWLQSIWLVKWQISFASFCSF